MTTKDRIIQLATDKGYSRTTFLRKVGISRGLLDANNLGHTVNDKQLAAIITAFPEVNLEWLVTGDGQMYKPTVILPHDAVSIDRYTELVRENERLRLQLNTLQQ